MPLLVVALGLVEVALMLMRLVDEQRSSGLTKVGIIRVWSFGHGVQA